MFGKVWRAHVDFLERHDSLLTAGLLVIALYVFFLVFLCLVFTFSNSLLGLQLNKKIQHGERHLNLISKKTSMYQNPKYPTIRKIGYIYRLKKLLDAK